MNKKLLSFVKYWHRSFAVLFLCVALCSTGCGRKGDPKPDTEASTFAFADLGAELTPEHSLFIQGRLTGNAQNAESVLLEIQPVDGELCLGCPFLAVESERREMRAILLDGSPDRFAFAVIPASRAEAFRWRLVGHNARRGFADVPSAIIVTGNFNGKIDRP